MEQLNIFIIINHERRQRQINRDKNKRYKKMRKLFTIILILISLNSFAQTRTQREIRNDNWLRLGLFTGSIALNAVGDGLNNSGNKEWGHVCNALSIGVTLSIPLIINVDKSNWYWYLLEYSFIRFAMFDYGYNYAANLPYDYVGDSNHYGQIMQGQDLIFPKAWSLTLGIAFNFTVFN